MFSRRLLFITLIALIASGKAIAQSADLCDAITTIAKDAPNKFRNIAGNEQRSAGVHTWDCGIKVPGTIASRFVMSMGLFYEGAFFQGQDSSALRGAYDAHKQQLSACLLPLGYKLSQQANFYPGLSACKKLVFMLDDGKAGTVPSHITMEATYNKDIGIYTVVMYIFAQ